MKLQDQVCTLEQAKRLKELRIKQNTSYFSWLGNVDYEPDLKSDDGNNYAAFTVAELGMMLPKFHPSYKGRTDVFACVIIPFETGTALTTDDLGTAVDMGDTPLGHFETASTEAEARAAMLIYLLENKLTTAEECNKRLK